jgi:hypothetical protein
VSVQRARHRGALAACGKGCLNFLRNPNLHRCRHVDTAPAGSLASCLAPTLRVGSRRDARAPGSRCALPTRDRNMSTERGAASGTDRFLDGFSALNVKGPRVDVPLSRLYTGRDARTEWIAYGGVKTTSSWRFPILKVKLQYCQHLEQGFDSNLFVTLPALHGYHYQLATSYTYNYLVGF